MLEDVGKALAQQSVMKMKSDSNIHQATTSVCDQSALLGVLSSCDMLAAHIAISVSSTLQVSRFVRRVFEYKDIVDIILMSSLPPSASSAPSSASPSTPASVNALCKCSSASEFVVTLLKLLQDALSRRATSDKSKPLGLAFLVNNMDFVVREMCQDSDLEVGYSLQTCIAAACWVACFFSFFGGVSLILYS